MVPPVQTCPGGFPHPCRGYPTLGTPYPDLAWGTPSLPGWIPHLGYPRLGLARGYPIPAGVPKVGHPHQTWLGYPPLSGVPPVRPGQGSHQTWLGYPLSDLPGVPPCQTWLGYLPSGPGQGTPPRWTCPRYSPCQTWLGYPPPHLDLAAVPPPPGVDRLKTLPFPILRMRSVTNITINRKQSSATLSLYPLEKNHVAMSFHGVTFVLRPHYMTVKFRFHWQHLLFSVTVDTEEHLDKNDDVANGDSLIVGNGNVP